MGRRRERTGFGRKQVLQLNDSRRDDSPYRGQGGQWPPRNEANALSGLMAHYGESEESEEEEEDVTPPPPPEPVEEAIPEPEERPVSPKPVSHENGHKRNRGKLSLDIDSKVANFLAEIDALDGDSNDIDGEPLPETDPEPAADSKDSSEVFEPAPPAASKEETPSDQESAEGSSSSEDDSDMPIQPEAPATVWHHCQDENTQYFYYWNTGTNEVTWEIPLEYSQYLLQMKEYEEALIRYDAQKAEWEEKKKTKTKTKRKKAKPPKESAVVEKSSNGSVCPESTTSEEAAAVPSADKKPAKSWFLKKIRETYGSKYDTEDQTDPTLEESGPHLPQAEVGPQLPVAETGPQLPVGEIGPQLPTTAEIGPQLPTVSEIGPQLPTVGEIGPQLPSEIGPQLPTEIGPQLPASVAEIGPQLPPVADIGPQLPEEPAVEPVIGPQLPPAASFGSVPPPADLYGPCTVEEPVTAQLPDTSDIDGEPMIGPQLPKEMTGDSSVYSAPIPDTRTGLEQIPGAYGDHEDSDLVSNSVGVTTSPAIGPQLPPNLVKAKSDDSGSESEEEDLDFIDKQLEEPLETQYVKKKPASKEKEVTPPKEKPEEKVEEEDDVEFDIDDIDQELEAALEKKKAEEKKQEKEDVPTSTLKRKQSEDHVEVEKAKKAKTTEEEPAAAPKRKMDKEEIKIKAEVADLATLVMDKLEFLDITRKGLSKLQMLLIEIETRIGDWREGALNTQYLLGRLEDAELQLQQYESSAAPAGWACHWDRTYKRYFYFHLTTGESQWDYPDDDGTKDVTKSDAHSTATESLTPSGEPVSSSQVETERGVNGRIEPVAPPAPLPQYAQVDSTTLSADPTSAAMASASSSSVGSTFTGKMEATSSSGVEATGVSGPTSSFAVDPSLFQDLFAPAPPPPAEPPPPGVEAAPSGLGPPRPPPGLATSSIPLSRSPPPPPPGTTPPPSSLEDVEMEMDATTSSLLAAAPPPPPPPDVPPVETPYQGVVAAPAVLAAAPVAAAAAATAAASILEQNAICPAPVPPPPVPSVILAAPYISNTPAGVPVPVPVPPPVNASTIVAPPVIANLPQVSGLPTAALSAPPQPILAATPPDTPPRAPVTYDPALDGVPLVDSSHETTSSRHSSSHSSSSSSSSRREEKRRKKEKKSAMGLSLKKKKLPSLVAKWQEVQEAVEREASKHAKEEESP